jgi:hypothetical protein
MFEFGSASQMAMSRWQAWPQVVTQPHAGMRPEIMKAQKASNAKILPPFRARGDREHRGRKIGYEAFQRARIIENCKWLLSTSPTNSWPARVLVDSEYLHMHDVFFIAQVCYRLHAHHN